MAVYVQKHWNIAAALIADGVSVKLGGNGTFLHVHDATGIELARFRAKTIRHYWIQSDAESSLVGPIVP